MDESRQEVVDEDDSDYGGSSKKSKKRGKKRKAKESKKSSKKKKKRKANSDLSDNEAFEEEEDYAPKAKSKKGSKKSTAESSPVEENTEPTVADVCENFGLNDVDFDYTDADFQNITTLKLYQQAYRSRMQSANPKVPQPKLSMLLAAKFREFQALGAEKEQDNQVEVAEEEEEEEFLGI